MLILFHVAAQVRPRQIGQDAGLVVRLLLVALPITVLLGFAGARLSFPHIPAMTALLLAAALAPTMLALVPPPCSTRWFRCGSGACATWKGG